LSRPAGTLSTRWLLSLYCVIRSSSPTGVTELSSHISSACAGTCDCTNSTERAGSIPAASSPVAISRVRSSSSAASYGWVMACRSTMQNRHWWRSWSATQFFTAPR